MTIYERGKITLDMIKITDCVYFYPPEDIKDRPMLGYIEGDKYSLAVDGGFSPAHVGEFYEALEHSGLKEPDYTALTHWHWDHTLGLCAVSGKIICEKRTDDLLAEENERLADLSYQAELKRGYSYVEDEFHNVEIPPIRRADIVFEDHKELDLGSIKVNIFYTEAPHTPDTTLVYVPEERVLFAGDAPLGDFDNNGYMDRKKMTALAKTISGLDCDVVLLGHSGMIEKDRLVRWLEVKI